MNKWILGLLVSVLMVSASFGLSDFQQEATARATDPEWWQVDVVREELGSSALYRWQASSLKDSGQVRILLSRNGADPSIFLMSRGEVKNLRSKIAQLAMGGREPSSVCGEFAMFRTASDSHKFCAAEQEKNAGVRSLIKEIQSKFKP